ncbi:Protein-disulfide isomerase [Geodermatophilus telluris]|uniref:Protein-disulfide isomerase n=1 Tax=Geodermatophilus telluris TaxID=1190417 RepID=A0A1G6QJF9_9ACTN|nr:thioredoxin domain-containing protein [Geodermatophilus telluris]SDC92519.1 Protein-disulfide isomerase [Geodermatophilus telluris]
MPADPTHTGSRTTARQRIEARRAAEAAALAGAQRRRRTMIGGVAAAVAVLVVLVVVVVVQSQRTATSAQAGTPANTVADGTAVRIGQADAPVTVTVYEDFLCPACKSFEGTSGDTLAALVADGTAAVEYRPVAILDHYSTDAYSTRALNAAGVVADAAGPEAFLAFHDLLFAHQPTEGGAGLPDDELIALAVRTGATGAEIESGIRDLVYADWTRRVTDDASRNGLTGTPTILVDGDVLETRSPQGLEAAVRDAAAA